ncbi:MAG: hypothetical protein COU25_02170 [Candidatus Levybacteria bacterium CG10_big_fil_rev_8_21_14_0_10_35_13]|nr:MAG: hypothetical protein COU25_02170 [Candidatus Levybacteria bacterium CG10_big_fil_rev_8_21_14_0_10_35_13]
MKETFVRSQRYIELEAILKFDKNPYSTQEYRTNRELVVDNFIGFDFFKHLWELAENNPNRRIEVLEGGCGEGKALEQLKKGGKISSKTEYRGLGQRIRTTGITLFDGHLEMARQKPEEVRTDEMIIGPIQFHKFDRKFDFIYDFCGAAMHFPESVIPIYQKILRNDRIAFMRLMAGAMPKSPPEQLFEQSGFEIIDQGGNKFATMDFIVRKI